MKTYQFKLVSYHQNWPDIAEDWHNLFLQAQSDPTSLPPFYHPIFLHAAQSLPKSDQPTHLILGYQGEELVFGLPIKINRPITGLKIAEIWGGPGFDYLAPIDITQNYSASIFFLQHVMNDQKCQMIKGEHLLKSFVVAGNSFIGSWSKMVFRCPYLQLPEREIDLLDSFDRHFRHNIRGSLRKVEANNIQFRITTSKDGTPVFFNALDKLFNLHRKRSLTTGRKSGFVSETTKEYYLSLVSQAQEWPEVVHFFELLDGNLVIASLFGYLIGGRFLSFQSGFSSEYSKISPGTIIIFKTMCYLIQKGATEFDFLRGADDYKFRWTATYRETKRFAYGPGLIGRTLTHQYRLKRAMNHYGRLTGLQQYLKNED